MKKLSTLLALAFCLDGMAQLTKLHDFDGTNGELPYGDLMLASDGMMNGITQYGGISNYGILFQYNPTTGNFIKKVDFVGGISSGMLGRGSLIQARDSMLYGMTQDGGSTGSNEGIIF